jgi:hypothetical protein
MKIITRVLLGLIAIAAALLMVAPAPSAHG